MPFVIAAIKIIECGKKMQLASLDNQVEFSRLLAKKNIWKRLEFNIEYDKCPEQHSFLTLPNNHHQ